MPVINQLPTVTTLAGSDLLPVYSAVNGDARKLSLTSLIAYFQSTFTNTTFIQNAQTPGDGFSITMVQDGQYAWLKLLPTGLSATGTVVLPAPSVAADGQEILITSTLQITSLTINGNGATAVYGLPGVFAAEDSIKFKYDLATTSWYKVA